VLLPCSLLGGSPAQQTGTHSESKQKDSKPAPSSVGRSTFQSICASCHGLDGRGGERGPDIATRPDVVRLSDAQILHVLEKGIPQAGMPAFASLGSETLAATVTHLRSLQGQNKLPAVLPGNPAKGKDLFVGKAACAQCHSIQGAGGFLGPDLTNYAANRSASEIRDVILSPDNRPGGRKALARATTKDGQTISGIVRNEDNFSLQLQSLDGSFHLLTKSDLAELSFDPKPFMPEDYAQRLTPEELDQLVSYVLSVVPANTKKNRAKRDWSED